MNMLSTVTSHPRLIRAAIFGALALSFGAVSVAGDNSDVPQSVVKFDDLDVSTPSGAAALYSRIAEAAGEVCESYDTDLSPLDLRGYFLQKACARDAIARAVSKVGVRELIAIYNDKNHRHRM